MSRRGTIQGVTSTTAWTQADVLGSWFIVWEENLVLNKFKGMKSQALHALKTKVTYSRGFHISFFLCVSTVGVICSVGNSECLPAFGAPEFLHIILYACVFSLFHYKINNVCLRGFSMPQTWHIYLTIMTARFRDTDMGIVSAHG